MPYYYNRYRGYSRFRRYYRRYGSRYTSVKKLTTTPNVKASAQNMTQGGKFTVTAHMVAAVGTASNTSTAVITEFTDGKATCRLNLPELVKSSEMHKALSNVFDQYRIDKLVMKIRDAGQSGTDVDSITLLPTLSSIVDRTGLANVLDLTAMKSYSSYKETQLSQNGDVSPIHTVYIGSSTIVEASSYFDTKNNATFPYVMLAVAFPTASALTGHGTYVRNLSIDIEAQVRYRGVRLDNSVPN